MERVIKFRIWNELGKIMLDDVENVYECLMQQIRFDNSQPSRMKKVKWDHRSEGMVWMQFTGLHDKDGKEIYEGDILKHPLAGEPEHLGFYVKFQDYKFVAVCIFPCIDESTGQQLETDFSSYFEKCEVIGNIYENPNLLK